MQKVKHSKLKLFDVTGFLLVQKEECLTYAHGTVYRPSLLENRKNFIGIELIKYMAELFQVNKNGILK